MKVLKWIGIILGVLIVILLIFTATLPDQLKVERSKTINSSNAKVFKVISDFTTWGEWSAWHKMDTTMDMSYEGEMNKVGAKSIWDSKNPMVGSGSQEIIELEQDKYFKSAMLFNQEPDTNYAWFTLEEDENGNTLITWYMEGAKTGFFGRLQSAIFKPMIEQSYDQSLSDLKGIVEAMSDEVANPMNLEIIEVEPMAIVSIKDSCTADGISAKLGELYGELSIYLAANEGANQIDMPLALYHHYSPEKVILEAALKYEGEVEASGRVMVSEIPAGKNIKGIHRGDYSASEAMHYAIDDYAKASNLEFIGPCWEYYANDPSTVDSADVETHIYYPVQ